MGMLELRPINNYIISNFLLADPKLAEMALPDELLEQLKAGFGYISPVSTTLGVYKDNELVCCILAYLLTNVTCDWHILLSSKWHNKSFSKDIQDLVIKYLKENTECVNMTTTVPKVCDYMHTTLLARGWKLTGIVPDGIKWRGVIQDYYLYHQKI